MKATKPTTTHTSIYWNEGGQIGCALPGHAPYRGTDSWVWERWRKITAREATEFEREVGRPPACETCQAIARRGPQADGS